MSIVDLLDYIMGYVGMIMIPMYTCVKSDNRQGS